MSFSWKELGNEIESIAGDSLPLIGGLIGGPLGSKVGSLVANVLGCDNTPDDISDALKNSPDALVKLKKAEKEKQIELAKIAAESERKEAKSNAAIIQAVNKTIQQEAMGSSWLQRVAHPLSQLLTVLLVIGVYFGLPLAHIHTPSVPSDAWLMLGAILGVTNWHSGRAKAKAVEKT